MKQVMIIDDSPRIRRRIAGLLSESSDIRIVGEAGNAADALAAVERIRPDTVILDIRLPGQSGIALLKTFKTQYPEMAVIMLTNLNDARYREQCRKLGADHFLSKTKEFESIVATVFADPTH
jgi:two-component system response regulator DevR